MTCALPHNNVFIAPFGDIENERERLALFMNEWPEKDFEIVVPDHVDGQPDVLILFGSDWKERQEEVGYAKHLEQLEAREDRFAEAVTSED